MSVDDKILSDWEQMAAALAYPSRGRRSSTRATLKRLAFENARLRAANEGLRALLNRCAPQVGSTDDPQYELACEVNLRLTQEEANALHQWVLERNGEDKPRHRPRRRG